jgi:hypothetical protein
MAKRTEARFPPQRFPVTLTRNDREYTGTYQITGTQRSGLWVEVSYGDHPQSASLGNLEADVLARMLLGELVTKHGNKEG